MFHRAIFIAATAQENPVFPGVICPGLHGDRTFHYVDKSTTGVGRSWDDAEKYCVENYPPNGRECSMCVTSVLFFTQYV